MNCHVRNRELQNQTETVPCTSVFIFILLCLIFSWFLMLFIYIINIGYQQVQFITQEQLGKSQPAISTFKCQGVHCNCTCFISNVPHLIKTARNYLPNSGSNRCARYVWNHGMYLIWYYNTDMKTKNMDYIFCQNCQMNI